MRRKVISISIIMGMLAVCATLVWAGNETGSNTWYGDEGGGWFAGGGAGNNSLFGAGAGYHVSQGTDNTLIGYAAGDNQGNGSYNTFLGSWAGGLSLDGSDSTSIGYQAGYKNFHGSGNVFLGYKSGYDEGGSNMLYIDNCLSGEPCHQPLIKGDFSAKTLDINGALTATGVIHSTSGGIKFPDGTTQGTAINSLGNSSLTYLGNSAGTFSGTYGGDVFIGSYAGYSNSAGSYNSFVGIDAGYANNAGSGNSLFGYQAGFNNTVGNNNTFIGSQAGYNSNSGNFNTFIGSTAGGGSSSHPGYSNVFVGAGTGFNNSGNGNVFLGNSAGYSSGSGNFNVFIGTNAAHDVTDSYKLYISSSNIQNATPLIYGDFLTGMVQISGFLVTGGAASLSDERLKQNIEPLQSSLDKVMSLKGVSYEWKPETNEGKGFGEGRQIGLIAQQVEAIIPELVHTDSKGYKSLQYDKLVPVLVEAIKEQQKKAEVREKLVDELLSSVAELKAEIVTLKSRDMSAQR